MNTGGPTLWTAAAAARATGAEPAGDWAATGVSIDTRTLLAGDLFVAIKGESFDGHDFVADAFAAGAAAAVVGRKPAGVPEGVPLLEVADTDRALESLGRAARERTTARVVAVTGSVGKTGTKEALRMALAGQGPTAASEGNLNNHWGLPLSLARMPAGSAFGVFEMGMNHPGEIAPLSKMAKPDVAVITTIEAVHKAHFGSLDGIADAKAEIFEGMGPDGTAVLNRDNDYFDRLAAAAEKAGVKTIIGFGTGAKAQVRLIAEDGDADGTDVRADVDGTEVRFRIGIPGRHWAMNALSVLAAVRAAGADVNRAATTLETLAALEGRGRRHAVSLPAGSLTIIDESYNASPVSMNAAFDVLRRVEPEAGGRRIAVLGDMLELGPDADALHAGLVDGLIAHKVNLVFTAGSFMAALWNVLPRAMQGACADASDAIVADVVAAVRPGDVVMVKGSAGSKTGVVVDALLDLGNGHHGHGRKAANG